MFYFTLNLDICNSILKLSVAVEGTPYHDGLNGLITLIVKNNKEATIRFRDRDVCINDHLICINNNCNIIHIHEIDLLLLIYVQTIGD